jgi:hypothetical protein
MNDRRHTRGVTNHYLSSSELAAPSESADRVRVFGSKSLQVGVTQFCHLHDGSLQAGLETLVPVHRH